jgi:phage nucleotide-binding protein
MAIKFSSFNEYFHDFHPHSLYYSWQGVGKTSFAGRTGMRTILLDCGDSGVVTLRGSNTKLLKIIRISSTSQYLEVMDEINRQDDKIELLVVDTLTGLQSIAIKEVKGRGGELNQRKWGQIGSKLIECISETKSFSKDVIYLAQERRRTRDEGEGDVTYIAPSLTPGVREYLSSCVDWVGRMYIEDSRRKLTFILNDSVEAKDRSSLFPKVLPLPSIVNGVNPAYLAIRKRIVEAVHG